jgi:hypothetical protein
VEKAVTAEKLYAIMKDIGGDYLGTLRHPSWNGYYGNNSVVLFQELCTFGVDCTGDCIVCDSLTKTLTNTSEKIIQN